MKKLVVFDLKKKFGLVLVILLLIGLLSSVQAVNIKGTSELVWNGDFGHISTTFKSDDASTRVYSITLDTDNDRDFMEPSSHQILPPTGCVVTAWGTDGLTIPCTPGLPDGPYDLTNVVMLDASGTPIKDFSGVTISQWFTGSSFGSGFLDVCIVSGVFKEDPDGVFRADFRGYCKTPTIGDYVWEDMNANGIQDTGEPGINDIGVSLYNCLTTDLVAQNKTDANGKYEFVVAPVPPPYPGNYYLEFNVHPGHYFTLKDQGSDDSIDSDAAGDSATSSNGKTACTVLIADETDTTWDVGLYRKVFFMDFVWEDINLNGIRDTSELGIAGVTVELYKCGTTTNPVASTITNADGEYDFKVPPGSYYVKFTAPTGYSFTLKDQVSDDSIDSDADTTGKTDCITFVSNDRVNTLDAGLYKTGFTNIKIFPKTINLGSKGYFLAFVTLPEAFKGATIDMKTVSCSGAPAVRTTRLKIFPRLVGFVFKTSDLKEVPLGTKIPLTVRGELKNSGKTYTFTGSNTVNVISKPSWQPNDIKDVSKLSDDQLFIKFST